MHQFKVAAHFAAFFCFLNRAAGKPTSPQDAGRLAREQWYAFLPFADEALTKLLNAKSVRPAGRAQPTRRNNSKRTWTPKKGTIAKTA
jgi:hypothetical protein